MTTMITTTRAGRVVAPSGQERDAPEQRDSECGAHGGRRCGRDEEASTMTRLLGGPFSPVRVLEGALECLFCPREFEAQDPRGDRDHDECRARKHEHGQAKGEQREASADEGGANDQRSLKVPFAPATEPLGEW